MNTIQKFINLGFYAADYHWAAFYFDISGIVVEDPREPEKNSELRLKRIENTAMLDNLIIAGNKDALTKIIDKGRSGLNYTLDKILNT